MKTERSISSITFLLCMINTYILAFLVAGVKEIRLAALNLDWSMLTVLSELEIVLPALLMLGIWYIIQEYRESSDENYEKISISERLMFKKVKISTLLMTALLTFLIIPLITLANYISMLFVDNEILQSSGDIVNMSVGPAIILITIFGPACEEFVFRGMIFGGYRRSCSLLASVFFSGLLFGLMHLNFNQFAYAFILGCAMAIAVEATGSIWPSMLMHFLVNMRSTATLFITNYLDADALKNIDMDLIRGDQYRIYFLVYAAVAIVPTIIAGVVIIWLAHNEGRENPLPLLFKKNKDKERVQIFTPALIIGILLALAYMIFTQMQK